MEIFLKGKCEDILKVRNILQSITRSPEPDVNKGSQLARPPAIIKTELTTNEKLKPKCGSLEVQSRALKYAAVIITNVIHPAHLYVQILDE